MKRSVNINKNKTSGHNAVPRFRYSSNVLKYNKYNNNKIRVYGTKKHNPLLRGCNPYNVGIFYGSNPLSLHKKRYVYQNKIDNTSFNKNTKDDKKLAKNININNITNNYNITNNFDAPTSEIENIIGDVDKKDTKILDTIENNKISKIKDDNKASEIKNINNVINEIKKKLMNAKNKNVIMAKNNDQTNKKNILIAGHNLHFIKLLIKKLENDYNVIIDKWIGHNSHYKYQSQLLIKKVDIIFCEWCVGNAVWYSNNLLPNQKLFIRFHRMELDNPYYEYVNWSNVTKIIFISPHIKQHMENILPVIKNKSVMIYNYIDSKLFDVKKSNDIDYNLGLLGYAPKLKRVDLAIKIYKKLKKIDNRYKLYIKGKHPQNIDWVWKNKEEQNYYTEIFKIINDDKDIIIEKYDKNIEQWFSKIGWILSTSDIEGSHQAVAEGMATGCIPIIKGGYVDNYGANLIYPNKFCYTSTSKLDINKIFWNKVNSDECKEYAKNWDIDNIYKQYTLIFNNIECSDSILPSYNFTNITYNSIKLDELINHNIEDTTSTYAKNNRELKIKYENIDIFTALIAPYKKILFVCNDYPGYGGAATNCYDIMKYYQNLNHSITGVFFTDEQCNVTDPIVKIIPRDGLKNFMKKITCDEYDLVIQRNWMELNIQEYVNCPVYYFIAGIYLTLDKPYNEITTKKEMDKYIHPKVINTFKNSCLSFVASKHTHDILLKYYNLKSYIMYFNYIPFYKKFYTKDANWYKRKYAYGLIVSNFDRQIKNVDKTINKIKRYSKKSILIGKNSHKYKHIGFKCMDLLPHKELQIVLKRIKCVVSDSFYESCSNVIVEAKFNGCAVNDIYENIVVGVYVTQLPFNGGASTLAYNFHNYLLSQNINSRLCFFLHKNNIRKAETDNLLINPYKYDNVWMLPNQYNLFKKYEFVNNTLKKLEDVNIVIAINYGVIPIIKNFFEGPMIYQITGSPEFTLGDDCPVNKGISYNKFMLGNYENIIDYNNNNSIMNMDSIKNSYVTLPNTIHTQHLYNKIYPNLINKIKYFGCIEHLVYTHKHSISEYESSIKKSNVKYDLIAISSNWNRIVKNIDMVYKIYNQFPNLNKIIIGTSNNNYNFNNIKNTTVLQQISNNKLHKYLAASNLLIVPSLFESFNITILEAMYNGCKILTSKNVAIHNILDDINVCNDIYDMSEWINKIKILLKTDPKHYNIEKTKNFYVNVINNIIINFNKINVLIACGDTPNIGGAATNSYNLLKSLKHFAEFNSIGMFISTSNPSNSDIDPDKIGNVYHIILDKDVEQKCVDVKKNIEKMYGDIDIIFCKNYKILPIIKKIYPSTTIIFSPSGMRYITAIISKKNVWYDDIKSSLNEYENIYIEYNIKQYDNVYDFIKHNDRYLDMYSMKLCDYILPNSVLTYDIIRQSQCCNENECITNKLLKPISLTYISNIKNNNIPFDKRLYDIGFICYSWKRQCKNYELIVNLVNRKELSGYNIIIVGHNQNIRKYKNNNVRSIKYIEKNKLLELYHNIKTLVIPSKYDSGPNVMVEALYNDCNVVTSKNVGNNEHLNDLLIVNNYKNIDEWISKIKYALDNKITSNYPTISDIESKFINLLKACIQQ